MKDDSILDSALLDELWGTVSDELAELGEEMESALLALEQDPADSETINTLFRAMHTYKSSTGMMGCSVTEALAHRSEDLVDYFRGKQLPLPATVLELLLETVDLLATTREYVSEQRSDAPADLTRGLVEKLSVALASAGGEVVVSVSESDFQESSLGLAPEEFAELWNTVSDEMDELLYTIEESLLALENDPTDSDLISQLFRAMHTFKSSSGMMGLTVMEQIAHRSEDLVGLLRDQGLALSEENTSLLLEALDRLRQLHQHASDSLGDGKLSDSKALIDQLIAAHQSDAGGSSGEKVAVESAGQASDEEFGFFDMDPIEPEEEQGFAFFDSEPADDREKEDGFGFFEPDSNTASEEEQGFAFFDSEPAGDGEEDDGFGFFSPEATEQAEESDFGFFEDDQKDLWELTIDETRENLDEIEAVLLKLEHDGSSMEQLDRLFRAIHTIKGTANVMGLVQVEVLAHRCEDLVGLLREGAIEVSNRLITLLLEAMDLIRGGLERILESKQDLTEQELSPTILRLEQFLAAPHAEETADVEEVADAVEDNVELEDPAKDPLYVQIFVDMGWEALEQLNAGVELLAGDATEAQYQAFYQELEEFSFAVERMGYEPLLKHLQSMQQQRDVQQLNEGIGWIGGQLTELETELQTGGLTAPVADQTAVTIDAIERAEERETAESVTASDDDFFGGSDAFDEVADQLPVHAPEGALYEPDGDDEVDPIFTPVFVQDFLEKEEEQLMGLRSIWGQSELSEQQRLSGVLGLLDEIRNDAEKMGYDHLIEILELGQLALKRQRGAALDQVLDELELKLYEEMTAIQEAIPDLNQTSTGMPLDISWVFRQTHAERVYEELAELLDLLDSLKGVDAEGIEQLQLEAQAEQHLRSIHHSAIFYELTAAAGLALSLADFYARITQHELNTTTSLVSLTREFVLELGGVIDIVRDGGSAQSSFFEEMMGRVENLLYMNSGSSLIQSARDVLDQLDLPEDFFEVFTPDSLQAVGSALERGYHFYIIHTDMDQYEEVATGFYSWSQSEEIEIITNFTVLKEDRSLFDFLIASTWDAEEVARGLVNIDPSGTLLRLRDHVLRSDVVQSAGTAQAGTVSAGNFSTAGLMETVGDLVSVQAMLHHVTHSFSKLDLLDRIDQEMKKGEDWKQVRVTIQDELEAWKRHTTVLGQLENEIGVSVGRLQELVHQADAVSASELMNGVEDWVGDRAAEHKKSVRLLVEGEGVEVERGLLEKLHQPLRELLEVSLCSIESVVERMEQGKSSTAELTVRLHKSHDRFEVIIGDDGGGFDAQQLQQQMERWQEQYATTAKPSLEQSDWLLQDGFGAVSFHDGESSFEFSPLRKRIEAMGGSLRIIHDAKTERGLQVRVSVPLSMAVINGLVVLIRSVRYVIPVHFVRRIVQIRSEQLVYASADGGQQMLHLDGSLIPLKLLAGMELGDQERQLMVVVEVGDQGELVACPVDELIDQQQVMIRPLKGVLSDVRDASGVAVLGDSEVGVVLRLESIH
ncbi:MAG: hypothetical protein HOD58_12750 [Gammaproteobacteria bacterium]|nr:hypothetical protein [Gammaproteobacteria bacterium]